MMIQIDSGKFLDFVALNEPAAALQYVHDEIKKQESEQEKYYEKEANK